MHLLIPFLLSLLTGILFALLGTSSRKLLCTLSVAIAAVQAVLLSLPLWIGGEEIILWRFSDSLCLSLSADGIGSLLGLLTGGDGCYV